MPGRRLIVVGSYSRDIAMAVDAFPRPGETVLGSGFMESDGGKGSNQAVQASRCGARVAVLAAVGDDAGGRAALELWRREGIDVDGVRTVPDVRTGVAMILVDVAGENQIVVDPGANGRLSPRWIRQAMRPLDEHALVLAQLESPIETVATAFGLARAAGAATLLNAAPMCTDLPAALWRHVDLLVVNELEAQALGATDGTDYPEIARRLRRQVGIGVVITLGARGAVLVADGPAVHLEAPRVEVIDATGAGDAFVGAFAAHWLQCRDLRASVRIGIAAGSLACTRRGAAASFAGAAQLAAMA